MSMVLNSLEVLVQNDTMDSVSAGAGTEVMRVDYNGLTMASGYTIKSGSYVYPYKYEIPFTAISATQAVSQFLWTVREGAWIVDGVSLYFQTGSTSGTLQVTRDTGTNAAGAGTVQLTGTISLAAASQQTVLNGTVIASPTEFGPGDRVGLLYAGTVTNLVALVGSVSMKRIR